MSPLRRRSVAIVRALLALVFVFYGCSKLVDQQLVISGLSETKLGTIAPWRVTWYFFSISPPYRYAIGASQVLVALLLLVPRTGAVGAIGFLAIISNIVLINFCYDVGVKFGVPGFAATDVQALSVGLLALDLLLIAHYWRRYRVLWASGVGAFSPADRVPIKDPSISASGLGHGS